MKDFLKKKYEYVLTCQKCNATTVIDTHKFFDSLETFKKFV